MKDLTDQMDATGKALLKELRVASQKVLDKYKLRDSDMSKSIEWTYDEKKDSFIMLVNDYYQWVDTGRRPRARKIPIEDLIPWVKKEIGSAGAVQMAWRIQQSIYKNGIKGKFYSEPLVDVTSEIISEKLATDLSEYICDDLVAAIENN